MLVKTNKQTIKNWIIALVQMLAFSYSYSLIISILLAMLTVPVNVQAQDREQHSNSFHCGSGYLFCLVDVNHAMPLGCCFI